MSASGVANPQEKMTIPELMSASNQKQPTDDITGAWPMLWRFNIRPLAEWYYIQSPSAPASYRQPVTVPDAPKPSVVVVEREEFVTAVVTESDSAVLVTVASPAPVSSVPAPDASDTVQTPVVSVPPGSDESTSTPEIPVDCFAPNPCTGYVPEPNGVVELGHGHPPRYEMWRMGNVLACELCGGVRTRTREERKTHRESEGHMFEMERQRLWSVKCVVCDRICDGLKCFDDHLAGKKHRRRLVMLNDNNVKIKGFCHGFFCDHEDCKK